MRNVPYLLGMKHFAAKSLALIAGLTLTAASAVPESVDVTPFSVVNLQKGAVLDIDYVSQGCFGGSSSALTLTHDTIRYNDEIQPLSLQNAQDLDLYLRKLASLQGQPGGCTTSTRLELTMTRGDARETVSLFHDFCSAFPGGTPGLSPDHLRYELFEKPDAEEMTPLPYGCRLLQRF